MEATHELMKLKEKLLKQIAVLQAEMDTVDRAIQLLAREDRAGANGSQNKRFRKSGLSESIRQVVESDWISPTEVRDLLMHGGYRNADKAKLLGSVFATMKRLGKTEFEMRKLEGKLKYRKKQAAANESAAAA
jgi:hypothetical protein